MVESSDTSSSSEEEEHPELITNHPHEIFKVCYKGDGLFLAIHVCDVRELLHVYIVCTVHLSDITLLVCLL